MIRYGSANLHRDEVRNVKARSLIDNFEQGKVAPVTVEESEPAPTTPKSPDVVEETAKPGTTKKLLAAFQELDKPSEPAPIRSPTKRGPPKRWLSQTMTNGATEEVSPKAEPKKPAEVKPTPAKVESKPKEEPKAVAKEAPKSVEKAKEEAKPVEKPKETPKPVEKPKAEAKPKEEPKPVEKPKEEPKLAEKPKEQPKPVEKPKEEPKPAEKPKEEPKPVEKPKEEPKPVEQPKEEPKPVEKPKDEPKPVEKLKEEPKPAEKPKEEPKPAEKPKEVPKPVEKPKEEPKPVEKPKEEPKPIEKPKEEPKPIEKPKEEPKPVEKPKEEPKPVEKPKDEPKPVEKPKEEPKPVEKPKEEPKPVEKPKEEPKPVEKPKEEPKPVEKPNEEPKIVVNEEPKVEQKPSDNVKPAEKPLVQPEPVMMSASSASANTVEANTITKTEVVVTKTEVITTSGVSSTSKVEEKSDTKTVIKTDAGKTSAPAAKPAKAPSASSDKKKHVLIVYVGLPKKTFDAALRDATVASLEKQGCKVTVSDLMAQRFNPVLSINDIGDFDRDEFDYVEDLGAALQKGIIAEDIRKEQEKVKAADLIIFHYQTLLHDIPAILLGWLQRVLMPSFAFDVRDNRIFDDGLLKGKKAMVSISYLGPGSAWTERGILGDINVSLWPVQNGILRFCGFEVLKPQLTYDVRTMKQGDRAATLSAWGSRLDGIWKEDPMQFIKGADFDYKQGWLLKDEAISRLLYSPGAPSTGQHLGRPLPLTSKTKL